MAALLEPTYTQPTPEGAQLLTREGKRFAKFKDRRGSPLHGSPTTSDHLPMTEDTMAKPKITLPPDLKNPDRLAPSHLKHLLKNFKHAEDPALVESILRYVVDGTGEEILPGLKKNRRLGNALELTNEYKSTWNQWGMVGQDRTVMICNHPSAPPEFWKRLGSILEALMRAVQSPPPEVPGWPGWLVVIVRAALSRYYTGVYGNKVWSTEHFARLLQFASVPEDTLVPVFLDDKSLSPVYGMHRNSVDHLKEYLSQHPRAVIEFLQLADTEQRLNALQKMSACELDLSPLLEVIVNFATGPLKTLREQAAGMLAPHKAAARPILERVLVEGKTDHRNEAVLLLWGLYGAKSAPLLRQRLEQEPSERVEQTIRTLVAGPEAGAEAPAPVWNFPPVNIPKGELPLPEAVRPLIFAYFERAEQGAQKAYEETLEKYNAPDRPTWWRHPPQEPKRIQPEEVEEFIRVVEGKLDQSKSKAAKRLAEYSHLGGTWEDWVAVPGVELVHVLRIGVLMGRIDWYAGSVSFGYFPELHAHRDRCRPRFGLRELDRALTEFPKYKPGDLARAYLGWHLEEGVGFGAWEPEAIWPIYAEDLAPLKELVSPSPTHPYYVQQRRPNGFRVLTLFSQLPAEFVPLLWAAALGEDRELRPLAQAALAGLPDKASKIIVALGDGRQETRIAAADWLGRLGDAAAVEALKQTMRKEKQSVVRGVLMSALERLGADVGEFLDREKLPKEADAGLQKVAPKGMGWLDLASLPELHWRDPGTVVDPRIVRWWVVQAVQLRSPAANPITSRHLAACRPAEAARLAKHLLSAWIAADGPIDQKGALSPVAAAADLDCVRMMDRFVRQWFGKKFAQSKALLEVLTWAPHPQAIQVLLAIADRFRTKSLRQAARDYIQELADRQGWTVEEFADHTIPDAGFARPMDENGRPIGADAVLLLDFGPRQFTVRLDDKLEPVITSEGKVLQSLPAAGKNDDPALADEAKQSLADAKKTVKEVVNRQTERLYEAMCAQRSWSFEQWRSCLADHPIVGRLCVRLVWCAVVPDRDGPRKETFAGCFRPLADGSLANEKDERFTPPPGARVRLAHTSGIPASLEKSWQKHLTDYGVEPLFPQFGRPTYTLPAEQKNSRQISDFKGYQLTLGKLQRTAARLGYVRGPIAAGNTFQKSFGSLGLEAVLCYTGHPKGQHGQPVTLSELFFRDATQKEDYWEGERLDLPLYKIPPVLLSEVYENQRQVAVAATAK